MDQAPPIRNPFVHVLKFTPLEKAKVKSWGFKMGVRLKKKNAVTLFVESNEMLFWLLVKYQRL